MPHVYIGEGDGLLERLDSHAKNRDFWTYCVAFTSKDQNLNKAHVQHLEARLIELAREAKRSELENGNVPQLPSLSEADRADAEQYLSDMLLCLPIVGITFLEKSRNQEDTNQALLLTAGGIKASGYEAADGFVVLSNSQAAKNEAPSIPPYLSKLRTVLLSQEILKDMGSTYQLVQDYVFSSPSTASGVLLGRSSNGRSEWKDSGGRSLREIQEEAVISSN